MKIIVKKNISEVHGGSGGSEFNDLDKIISRFGNDKIKGISIKKIIVRSGDSIDCLQFFYNIETEKGSKEFVGNVCGNSRGGRENIICLNGKEKITKITGQVGKWGEDKSYDTIRNLVFKTSYDKTYSYCQQISGERFSLSSEKGEFAIFGRSGDFLDSLGLVEFELVDSEVIYLYADKIDVTVKNISDLRRIGKGNSETDAESNAIVPTNSFKIKRGETLYLEGSFKQLSDIEIVPHKTTKFGLSTDYYPSIRVRNFNDKNQIEKYEENSGIGMRWLIEGKKLVIKAQEDNDSLYHLRTRHDINVPTIAQIASNNNMEVNNAQIEASAKACLIM